MSGRPTPICAASHASDGIGRRARSLFSTMYSCRRVCTSGTSDTDSIGRMPVKVEDVDCGGASTVLLTEFPSVTFVRCLTGDSSTRLQVVNAWNHA